MLRYTLQQRKPRDVYCADGIISHGERVVRKGGVVYFGGYRIQHEALLKWIGERVFVAPDDYFFSTVTISDARSYTSVICTASVEIRKPIKL